MLKDGKYAAWFRTPRGQGTGIVHLIDGTISGCDGFFTYGGSYRVDGHNFTAELAVRRHADGAPSVFGVDEVEVSLTGVCHGAVATCSGSSELAPDLLFEVTLIYSREEEAIPDVKCAVVKLKADKLPKGLDTRHDSRSRSRHPLPVGPSKNPAS